MHPRVKITRTETLSGGFIDLKRYTLDQKRRDGRWQTISREVHDHGNAAAVLLVDPKRHTVILVRQFRLPAMLNGEDPWLYEVVAGLTDGADPADTARREALEETGYRVSNLRFAFRAFTSPGAVTERSHMYVADYDAGNRQSDGGGLHHEGEDIEVIELSFAEALAMITDGRIIDTKTIVLLQYAALNNLV